MALINIETGKRINFPSEPELKVSGSFYAFALSWGDYEVLSDSKDISNLRAKLKECLISEGIAKKV